MIKIYAWNGCYGCERFECYYDLNLEHNIEKWVEYYKEKYPCVWVEKEV